VCLPEVLVFFSEKKSCVAITSSDFTADKGHNIMSHCSDSNERYTALLAKLSPVVEVSALIRPYLLLMALLAPTEHIVMGVLYHTQHDAFQVRLRFSASAYPDFARRTQWRPVVDQLALEQWTHKVIDEFTALAATLGAETTTHLEFPPNASDKDIRTLLLTSPVAAAFS
jgi:hypothetical protein